MTAENILVYTLRAVSFTKYFTKIGMYKLYVCVNTFWCLTFCT